MEKTLKLLTRMSLSANEIIVVARKSVRLEAIILLLLLLPFLYFPVSFFYHTYLFIQYPYEDDPFDGYILARAYRLYMGQNPYPKLVDYPFLGQPYPPVYDVLIASLMPFLGETLATGRLITAISALFIGFLIYLFVHRRTESKAAGFIVIALFYSLNSVFYWGTVCRPDMLGMLFALIGVYYTLQSSNKNHIIYAIFFFFLSLYTKQSYLSAPTAAFIYLLMHEKKKAFKFSIGFAALVAVVFLILNYATEGQFYVYIIKVPMSMGISIDGIKAWVFDYYLSRHFIILSFAFSYVLFNRKDLFSIYYLISLFTFVSLGKPGSYINHFIENLTVVCILVGFQLKNMINAKTSMRYLAVLLLLSSVYYLRGYEFNLFKTSDNPLTTVHKNDGVLAYVRNASGRVYTEYASLSIINNKTDLVEPWGACYGLYDKSWNFSRITEDCYNQNFEYIILKENTLMNCHFSSCLARYKLIDRLPGAGSMTWLVYQPRKDTEYEIKTTGPWIVRGPLYQANDALLTLPEGACNPPNTRYDNFSNCFKDTKSSVDFIKTYGPSGWDYNKFYAYSSTCMYMPQEKEGVLEVYADDGPSRVVFNNAEISPSGSRYNVKFREGWNTLSIRVYNEWGEWGLETDITDSEDKPLTEVRYCTPSNN